jgi:hypothetical protein
MANNIIKSVGCTIKLKENPNLKVDITIGLKTNNQKFWQLISNPINQLKLPAVSGNWVVFENELHLFPKGSNKSFIAMNSVPESFLDLTTCGKSSNGTGTLFAPPPFREIGYVLWFGCI